MSTTIAAQRAGVLSVARTKKRIDVSPYELAVLASVTLLDPVAAMQTGKDTVEKSSRRGKIVPVSNILWRKILQFALCIAGHPLVSLVGRHISVLEIRRCNADCGRLKHCPPTLLTRAQRRLGPLAIGDIDDDCADESRGTVCRRNDKCADIGPYDLAVLASIALLLPSDDVRIDPLSRCCPIVFVSYIQCRKLSQLVLGIARHPLETLIGRQIASVLEVEHCDADRGGLEHCPPALFGRAQRRFRPLAIGDVDSHSANESGRAIRRGNEKRIDVGPHDLTILATETLFYPMAALRTGDELVNTRQHCRPIILVGNIDRLQTTQLLLGIAGHPLETLVSRHISEPQVGRRNAYSGRLEHGSPALVARSQRRFGLHALGDVHVNGLQKRRGGLGWRHHCRCDVQPHQAAVLFQVLLFNLTLCQRGAPEFC